MSSSLLPSEGAVGWAATANNALSAPQLNGFRLTIATGQPVPPDGTAASTTMWLTPYLDDRISLFDGTNWQMYSTAGQEVAVDFTQAANNLTSGTNYDLFVYDSGGSVTFDAPVAWTSDKVRATSLGHQNGVPVKLSDKTRRYVGTIRASAANTVADSVTQRYVWNFNNRVLRHMKALESAANWSYTSTTWRPMNNNTANAIDLVRGLDEDSVVAFVLGGANNNTSGVSAAVGVGIGVTNANSATLFFGWAMTNQPIITPMMARYTGMPGAGRYLFTALESSTATGTTSWFGTNASSFLQSGITGEVLA